MSEVIEQEIRTLRAHFWSDRDPEGRAFVPLADAYRRKGDLEEAASLVKDGLARLPEFTPGHLVAARIHRARGNLEEAREALNRVLELDGHNVLALLERAELARDTDDPEGAVRDLRRLLELDPGHMGARAALDRLEASGAGTESGQDGPEIGEIEEEAAGRALGGGDPDSADAAFDPLDLEPDLGEAGLEFEPTSLAEPSESELAEEGLEPLEDVPDEEEAGSGTPADDLTDSTDEGAGGPGAELDDEVDAAFDEAFQPTAGDLDVFDFDVEELDEESTEARESTPEGRGFESQEQESGEISRDVSEFADVAGPEASEAEDAAQEEETDSPDSSMITRTMADLFARQGLIQQAVEVYERLLKKSPDDPEIRERLEELRARTAESADEAEETLEAEPEEVVEAETEEVVEAETEEVAGAEGVVEAEREEIIEAETDEAVEKEADEAVDPEMEGTVQAEMPEAVEVETEPTDAPPDEEPALEEVAPQWSGDEPGDDSDGLATPFAWDSEEGEEAEEPAPAAGPASSRTIRDHFEDLLAWSPGAVPVEHLAPDAPAETAPPGSLAAEGEPEPETKRAAGRTSSGESVGSGGEGDERGGDEGAGSERGGDEREGDDDLDDFRSWLKSLES